MVFTEMCRKCLVYILLFIKVCIFLILLSTSEHNFIFFPFSLSYHSGQSLKDGLPYVLRKVDVSLRINVDFALKVFEKWKAIQCSSIITFREVFRSSRM